jgi:hypothetical protein
MASVTIFRPGRMFAAAAVLAAVALAASGCAAIENLGQHLEGLTTAPKVGDCWTTTFAAAQGSEDWEGVPAVSCAKAHESYTYAMTKLGTKFTYKTWLESNGDIRPDVDKAAYTACMSEEKRILPGITTKEALLYPTYYIPSEAMWGAGSRWVRCDITQISVGSLVAKPKLAHLPAFGTLVTTLKDHPQKYALCEDDPASNGPDGDQATYADCTGPADWSFVAALVMAGADGAPYPSAKALAALGAKQCATLKPPAGHTVFAEPPAKNDWTKYDDRELDCWVNNN